MQWVQNILVISAALIAVYILYAKLIKKKKTAPGCDNDNCGC